MNNPKTLEGTDICAMTVISPNDEIKTLNVKDFLYDYEFLPAVDRSLSSALHSTNRR